MASRNFALNTEPHEAVIGSETLLFQPEVIGAEFAQAYAGLKEAQKRMSAAGEEAGADDLLSVNEAMRGFLARLMLPESVKVFDGMQLPDRVLVQLLEWVAELYGGGSGNDRGGPSSKS